MFKKLKEKKGFTLVELIVVLVILAILAALLIPALTGYIDKAKRKNIVAETRQVVMAAQTLVDDKYAKADVGADTVKINGENGTVKISEIKDLAEVKGTIDSVTVTNGKVMTVEYTNNGKKCTYHKDIPEGTTYTDGNYDVAQ